MSMDIDFAEYKLSSELRGHEDDVRGICVCDNVGIATSSRDRTVRFWTQDQANGRDYATSKILLGHTSFVGPLAWISPDEEFPEGGVVSGGMDTLVVVWDLRTGEAKHTLKGHQYQVTGIALDGGDIVSSSVDCSLRRWRKGQIVDAWDAHKVAIQAVIKLPSGELVTGSSDTTLKLWRGKTCVHTFAGHADTVRGLAVMPGLGVLSASHDGSIRLWATSGEVLLEMVGHTSLVYSVDSHASGLIGSGSEDCSAKIWKDGVCIQTLEHPGCVWDTKFLESGDLVTACSDGVVRIWTVNPDLIADSALLESFSTQISHYKISRKKVGGIKLEDLPGVEALRVPGTSDGQTKIVREGDNGVAYAWNLTEQKWDKIGEVVDGPDDSLKQPVLDGARYDFVFDVDIGDGEPIRKLPYNRAGIMMLFVEFREDEVVMSPLYSLLANKLNLIMHNPYDTADKWLVKENLPLSYRQQVVDFILQNSGQRDFTLDTSFRDPYTGANAYVPGQPSKKFDTSAKPSFKHIPKRGMVVLDAAQFDGILKKVSEFNSTLISDTDRKGLSLTEVEVSRLGAITKILKDTSHYHTSTFSDVDVTLLLKLLKSWPVAMIFPVIDILRMMVLHPDGATRLLKHLDDKDDVLLETIKNITATPPLPGNLLTSIRLVTNLFKTSIYYQWLLKHRSEILDAFSSCYSSSNKHIQISYATLVLNYSVLLIEKRDEEGQSQVISAALEIAEEENLDGDSRYRAFVAIGSLMLDGLVRKIALDFDVEKIAKSAKASKDSKLAEVGADIESLIMNV